MQKNRFKKKKKQIKKKNNDKKAQSVTTELEASPESATVKMQALALSRNLLFHIFKILLEKRESVIINIV